MLYRGTAPRAHTTTTMDHANKPCVLAAALLLDRSDWERVLRRSWILSFSVEALAIRIMPESEGSRRIVAFFIQ